MAIAVQQGVVSVGVCVTWLVLCAALVQQSEGALPPLDRDERWRSADVVVNGRVLSIVEQPHESHDNHELGDTLYSAVVHVDDVFQMTRQEPVRRRSNLQVFYWLPAKRPDGWVGHTGQYVQPEVGQEYKFFLAHYEQPLGNNRAAKRQREEEKARRAAAGEVLDRFEPMRQDAYLAYRLLEPNGVQPVHESHPGSNEGEGQEATLSSAGEGDPEL